MRGKEEERSFGRNDTRELARRVRRNLDFIIEKRGEREDVHEVTQLVVSLLGLIVFPWESGMLKRIESLRLRELSMGGWPQWDILLDEKDDTHTLGKLIWHLRNAASHRRLSFFPDDGNLQNVEIEFQDAPNKANAKPNWCAKIKAVELKKFCYLLLGELEGSNLGGAKQRGTRDGLNLECCNDGGYKG